MKRILFVVPDLKVGGVQRSLVTLLNAAPLDRLDITLLTFREGGELHVQIPERVHLKAEPRIGQAEKTRAVVSKFLRRCRLKGLFDLAKRVYHHSGGIMARGGSGEEYDVAVAYSDGLATWYVAQRVRAAQKIAFVHTDFSKAGYDTRQERKIYGSFEQIVFASHAARRSFLSALPECEERTVILPNAVDIHRVLKLAEEPVSCIEKGKVKLATVGRLSHEKGVEKIPSLLCKLKDAGQRVCWYIVGDGPERENLLRQARRLGVERELVLTGQLENPYPYMRECDVYVQPSEYEGYCIALAEARLLCRPVVACDFAGAREQIENGVTGFVAGMRAEELFPYLLTLVSQPQKRVDFQRALAQKQDAEEAMAQVYCWWKTLGG